MERDDIIEYSLDAHHGEDAGKKIRKKIFQVTIILSVLTAIEVLVGVFLSKIAVGAESATWASIKLFYVVLTFIKAGYIVMVFMHLGEERKGFKWIVLAPYALFILYLLYMLIVEANM